MTDLVNSFFRRHYPADAATNWEPRHTGSGSGREYAGDKSRHPTIFPDMVCADGFRMSVQGHFGAYSHPRDDFADGYRQVEISVSPGAEPMLDTYGRQPEVFDDFAIYPYVPVPLVEQIIEKHGGLKV